MHRDTAQSTNVTWLPQQPPQPQQQSSFALVVHRLDDHSAKLEKLDAKVEALQARLDAVRFETRDQIQSMRNDMQANFENFRKDMKADMRDVVSAAMGPVNERFNTVEERIKHASTAADNKLLRWCAGSAAGSSSLACLLPRLLS